MTCGRGGRRRRGRRLTFKREHGRGMTGRESHEDLQINLRHDVAIRWLVGRRGRDALD